MKESPEHKRIRILGEQFLEFIGCKVFWPNDAFPPGFKNFQPDAAGITKDKEIIFFEYNHKKGYNSDFVYQMRSYLNYCDYLIVVAKGDDKINLDHLPNDFKKKVRDKLVMSLFQKGTTGF